MEKVINYVWVILSCSLPTLLKSEIVRKFEGWIFISSRVQVEQKKHTNTYKKAHKHQEQDKNISNTKAYRKIIYKISHMHMLLNVVLMILQICFPSKDLLKSYLRVTATSFALALSILLNIPSGPVVLFGFKVGWEMQLHLMYI